MNSCYQVICNACRYWTCATISEDSSPTESAQPQTIDSASESAQPPAPQPQIIGSTSELAEQLPLSPRDPINCHLSPEFLQDAADADELHPNQYAEGPFDEYDAPHWIQRVQTSTNHASHITNAIPNNALASLTRSPRAQSQIMNSAVASESAKSPPLSPREASNAGATPHIEFLYDALKHGPFHEQFAEDADTDTPHFIGHIQLHENQAKSELFDFPKNCLIPDIASLLDTAFHNVQLGGDSHQFITPFPVEVTSFLVSNIKALAEYTLQPNVEKQGFAPNKDNVQQINQQNFIESPQPSAAAASEADLDPLPRRQTFTALLSEAMITKFDQILNQLSTAVTKAANRAFQAEHLVVIRRTIISSQVSITQRIHTDTNTPDFRATLTISDSQTPYATEFYPDYMKTASVALLRPAGPHRTAEPTLALFRMNCPHRSPAPAFNTTRIAILFDFHFFEPQQ